MPDHDSSSPDHGAGRQSVYRWFFGVNLLIIVLVFAEPTIARLTRGQWQRGTFVFENTLSLDAHALFGYVFVLIVITQAITGFAQGGRARLQPVHRRLGRVILLVGGPLFVGVGVWMIFDRGLGLPPGRTIVFRKHGPVLIAELVQVMALVVFFLARGWLAIRRRDVPAHVDAMLTAFIVAGMIAMIRFEYALIWLFTTCPLSVSGMYFLTVLVTAVELGVAFWLSGRLRANAWAIAVLVGTSLALGLIASPWHSIWDA